MILGYFCRHIYHLIVGVMCWFLSFNFCHSTWWKVWTCADLPAEVGKCSMCAHPLTDSSTITRCAESRTLQIGASLYFHTWGPPLINQISSFIPTPFELVLILIHTSGHHLSLDFATINLDGSFFVKKKKKIASFRRGRYGYMLLVQVCLGKQIG